MEIVYDSKLYKSNCHLCDRGLLIGTMTFQRKTTGVSILNGLYYEYRNNRNVKDCRLNMLGNEIKRILQNKMYVPPMCHRLTS